MKKVAGCFGLSMAVLLMAAAVLTFLAPRFGWRVDVVMAGSMETELRVGGLVITRPVESKDIKVGDIVTFYCPLNNGMTTHRVIALPNGTLSYFRTKGDANGDPDPFIVPAENIAGRVCLHVPYLGYVAHFMRTPLGIVFTLCIPGLAITVMEVRNIRRVLRGQQTKTVHPPRSKRKYLSWAGR